MLHPEMNTHKCLETWGDQGQVEVLEADTATHVISSWTKCPSQLVTESNFACRNSELFFSLQAVDTERTDKELF